MEQQTGSKLGKEYIKAVYCYPAYLTFRQSNPGMNESQAGIKISRININNLKYAEYIMRTVGLDEAQAGIKITWININNQICRCYHIYGRK